MCGGVALGNVLMRDRALVGAGLVGVAAAAWLYTAHLARTMGRMDVELVMPQMQTWGAVDLALLFAMWAAMMVAMMVPSATPMILAFARVNRNRRERGGPFVPTAVFLLGYLLVWTGFSVLATLAQWGLHANALLAPTMATASAVLGGGILVAAGAFQWTPLKHACLTQCRSPLGFLSTEWREGVRGALLMGVRHGSYCVGCCWMLMALLFVVGVMNLLWIAAIAGFILLEKIVSRGAWVSRAAGALLVGAGVWMAGTALV